VYEIDDSDSDGLALQRSDLSLHNTARWNRPEKLPSSSRIPTYSRTLADVTRRDAPGIGKKIGGKPQHQYILPVAR